MNVAVTKPTKKNAATKAQAASKAVAKIASSKKAVTAAKSGGSRLTKAAGKLVKTLVQALHPADGKKTPPAAAKPRKNAAGKANEAALPIVKPPAKPAASAAAKAVKAAKAAPAAKPAGKNTRPAPVAAPKKPAAQAASQATRAGARSQKAAAGIADTIDRIVVSRASEVATKTSKPTSTVPTEETVLTEAQILKMSDKDYMNAAQLSFFKARLQQLERDLLKNAGETTEHLRETVVVPDPADRATIEEEHALELRTRDRERKLLKKVQQSLASIESGDYGWCEETGEPIGIARLLARPTATLSLEAQQRRELKQKLYGD